MMSSLPSVNNISKSSLSLNSKYSKKSRSFGSLRSIHGSKFGRSINRIPMKNDISNVKTAYTVNSRIISTFFGSNLKSVKLPEVVLSTPTEAIRELGQALDVVDYEFNYVSFWLLDVFTKVLKEAQVENISNNLQVLLLSWLQFALRSISLSVSSREDMFMFLEDIFISALSIIKEGKPIPLPEDVSILTNNEASQEISSQLSKISSAISSAADVVSSKKLSQSLKSISKTSKRSKISSGRSLKSSSQSETMGSLSSEEKITMNLNMFYKIVETLYKVFADRYVYKLVSMAYSSPVTLTPVDVQIDFMEPKQQKPEPVILDVVKMSGKGKSPLTKEKKSKKGQKSTQKHKKNSETKKKEGKVGKSERESGVEEVNGKRKGKSNKGAKQKKDAKSSKNRTKSSIRKGRKSVKDKRGSMDERQIVLETLRKKFDRNKDLQTEKDLEQQNNNYLLPLSEAVGEDFVKKLIKPLMPEESKEPTESKTKQKKGKISSIKSGTKKEKSKKKKK